MDFIKKMFFFVFNVAGEETFLSKISEMSVYEASTVSITGSDSYLQEESETDRWKQLYPQSSRRCWFSTVHSINRERYGEGTVERNPRPSEISSSQTKRAVLWRWERGRDEARLDAGSRRHRPHLCDHFRHLHHRRNSRFLYFVCHSPMIVAL